MSDTAVAVIGITGRMGRLIAEVLGETPGVALAAGTVRPGSAVAGGDLGTLLGGAPRGILATDDAAAAIAGAGVTIDCTLPAASVTHARLAAESGTPIVIGTTGLDKAQEAELAKAATRTAVVYAANMSLGVNLLLAVVEQVAAALDDGFDIEIVEMHHNKKIDAPSGTALALGRAAALGRGVSFDEQAVLSREGHTGARKRGTIGFATLRGGDVPGEHTVTFAGTGERIELGHRAGSRKIFAVGAVTAARWVVGRKPGLYTMRDVLGL